jgi:hypothetical protein
MAIPWDKTVEYFQVGPDLRVSREDMTLRQAVDRFTLLSEDQRRAAGVGIHEPYITTVNGRPVAVGFLNAAALQRLADGSRDIPEWCRN